MEIFNYGKQQMKYTFYKYRKDVDWMDEDLKHYIKQLEDENVRLKLSIKSLRTNNRGLMQGLNKVKKLLQYQKKYGILQ